MTRSYVQQQRKIQSGAHSNGGGNLNSGEGLEISGQTVSGAGYQNGGDTRPARKNKYNTLPSKKYAKICQTVEF